MLPARGRQGVSQPPSPSPSTEFSAALAHKDPPPKARIPDRGASAESGQGALHRPGPGSHWCWRGWLGAAPSPASAPCPHRARSLEAALGLRVVQACPDWSPLVETHFPSGPADLPHMAEPSPWHPFPGSDGGWVLGRGGAPSPLSWAQ